MFQVILASVVTFKIPGFINSNSLAKTAILHRGFVAYTTSIHTVVLGALNLLNALSGEIVSI